MSSASEAGAPTGWRFWRSYEVAVNAVAVVLFAAMVVVTAAGVFFRYVLDAALPWAEEADRYLFIWLSFVGAAITMRHQAHIAVDILVRNFGPAARNWAALLSHCCILVFVGTVFWASERVIEITSVTRTTATDIPMSWVYLAVPVGCTLIAIEVLRLAAGTVRRMTGARRLDPRAVAHLRGAHAVERAGVVRDGAGFDRRDPVARQDAAQHRGYSDGRRDGLVPADGDSVLHPGRRTDGACRHLRAAGEPGQGAGGTCARWPRDGGDPRRISVFGYLGLDGRRHLGDRLDADCAMERAGYHKGEAIAIVCAATAMGILVPPCIFMIVLASMTNQSIGAMFVAGFVPAVVIAVGLIAYVYWRSGKLGIPRAARASGRQVLRALGDGVIAMVMPLIIFGAIFGGVTTVTEAAVVAVLYAAALGSWSTGASACATCHRSCSRVRSTRR